jgi:hypothetical protein
MMEAIKEEAVGFLFNVEVQPSAAADVVSAPAPAADLVATGPDEAPGEVFVEHLAPEEPAPAQDVPAQDVPAQDVAEQDVPAQDVAAEQAVEHAFDATPGEPAQALPVEPVGVAGSPVPSAAPASQVQEPSLDVEHPELPTPVAGPGAGEPQGEAAVASSAAPAESREAADPVGASLPDDFGRPERAQDLQYSGPALDAAPGSTGVTRSTGPGGTGVATGTAQGRNEDCACGSGKKYKRCHGDPRRA